jgi:hypothetical protein
MKSKGIILVKTSMKKYEKDKTKYFIIIIYVNAFEK